MRSQTKKRAAYEAILGQSAGSILHIILFYFIMFPLSGAEVTFIETVTSITPLLPLYIAEIYILRLFFTWWWKDKKIKH